MGMNSRAELVTLAGIKYNYKILFEMKKNTTKRALVFKIEMNNKIINDNLNKFPMLFVYRQSKILLAKDRIYILDHGLEIRLT